MSQDLISINKLSKTYSNGLDALKNVNLNIKKGEIIAMLGPNGAGKTTLISIICGLVNPSSGKVDVDGFDIIDKHENKIFSGLFPKTKGETHTFLIEDLEGNFDSSESAFFPPSLIGK